VQEAARNRLPGLLRIEASNDRQKLEWLVRVRWVALAAQLGSSFVGLQLGFLAGDLLPFYFAVVTGLAVWNALTAFWSGMWRCSCLSMSVV
jgi:hypothetical protein